VRKVVIAQVAENIKGPQRWLDISSLATAELSSEDPAYPFENALSQSTTSWRALEPGPQTIRLRFDQPIDVRRLRLEFRETRVERSQEFAVVAEGKDGSKREIIRQQWNFTPNNSPTEIEDFKLELRDVICLELTIDPGRHDRTRLAAVDFIGLG
jgi:hypothetical protein